MDKRIIKIWNYCTPKKRQADMFAKLFLNPPPQKYIDKMNIKYTPEYVLAHYGQSINEKIRNYGIHALPKDRKQVIDLVKSHHNKTEIILHRGVPDPVYDLMVKNAEGKDCDLYEKAFLSCSLVKGCEYKHPKKLRIKVPIGTSCIYLGNINDEPNYEVVVMTGAELKIIGKDKEYIYCELIKTD